MTFPGTGNGAAVSHVLVQQGLGKDGDEDSCSSEVQKVVELMLEHARKRPNETLGVITMGVKHRDRVQRALDVALQSRADLEQFFDESKTERYFIKNLEQVQGDERDAIIISIGYGKDRSGNLPFRFGPLLSEGGRRRLNVAGTRARQRLTLVSSFSHLDMDARRIRPGTGVELLKNYLEYADSNGLRMGETYQTEVSPNAFEQDVFDTLTAAGLKLVSQLGASRFRIDLAAEHPTKPGQYVLAIECDGATYHSGATARDRDRLRQRQLENLGWRFHRIWSTDWFMHKDEEVKRTLDSYRSAVHVFDNGGLDVSPTASNATLESTGAAGNRGRKPLIVSGLPITNYTSRQIVDVVAWISSDGLVRTDDELLKEAVEELGFARRGARIEAAVRQAIREWRCRPNSR